jgi:uncharacterized membrane protein YphA (DoxX/SURF4 family)
MKSRTIAYWITTALTAFVFLSSGAAQALRLPFALKGLIQLGYPPYFSVILGAWKFLGGLAVLLPGTKRLKEWAYAGMLFDLTGASFSHFSVNDPAGKIAVPLIILIIVAASWALRPPSRKLVDSPAIAPHTA